MVHSNNNNIIIIIIVLIPEVPILDQMHLQLNPACNLRFKNEKKKQLGLLHLKITLFFSFGFCLQRIPLSFLFFLGYPSLKSKLYFLPAEHCALFFSFLSIFSFCSKSGYI
jgi:hypothetical protein